MWNVKLSKRALQDSKKVQRSPYKENIEKLLRILKNNPLQTPPPYEKLEPPRDNHYSRRINSQHRLVYEINENEKSVKILSLWTHYE